MSQGIIWHQGHKQVWFNWSLVFKACKPHVEITTCSLALLSVQSNHLRLTDWKKSIFTFQLQGLWGQPLQSHLWGAWSPDHEWNLFFFLFFLSMALSQWDFSHEKFRFLSLGKASCDSRAIQPMVHTGCFSVSIIHQTLTWTISNKDTDVNACDCTWGCTDTIRESTLKVDSGRKIPCRTRLSNRRQQRAGSDALATELHPHPYLILMDCLIGIVSYSFIQTETLFLFFLLFFFSCLQQL